MKIYIHRFPLLLALLLLFSLNGCEDDPYEANQKSKAVVSTVTVTDVSETQARSGGIILSDGGLIIKQRGVCWSAEDPPTIENAHTNDGAGLADFFSIMSPLMPNTTYFVRAYATNALGTSYGESVTFTTLEETFLPGVITKEATEITYHSLMLHGEVTDMGNSEIQEQGFYFGPSANAQFTGRKITTGINGNAFAEQVPELTEKTTYYFRAFARNAKGEKLGQERSARTLGLPRVITHKPLQVTNSTAILGGEVIDDGELQITERGIYISREQNVETSGTMHSVEGSLGKFQKTVVNLTDYTRYYYKAFARNGEGTSYGELETFLTGGTVTDLDNNTYYSIQIGSQEWLAQNLIVTRYRNGDPVMTGFTASEWQNLSTGAYAVYSHQNQDAAGITSENQMKDLYGLLYNWYAVADPRGLCPQGYHVPTQSEWETLYNFLGQNYAGGKLKTIAVEPDNHPRWIFPNNQATDELGFGGLPSGRRNNNGTYEELGKRAYWWTRATYADSPGSAHFVRINQENPFLIFGIQNKKNGFSVRCIKDI